MTEHPRKDVWVEGQAAQAIAIARAPKAGNTWATVQTDEQAAWALEHAEEGDEHNCPLCHEYFNTADFKAHAPQCILVRAGKWERQRDRDPAFMAGNDLKVFRSKLFTGA